MPNVSERKDVRRLEKAARIADAARESTIRSICSTEAGRLYLWDRLSAAHIFSSIGPTDIATMAFAEGERNSGLQLLGDILRACPERFIEMMREKHVRDITNDARDSADLDADAFSSDPSSEPTGGPEPGRELEGHPSPDGFPSLLTEDERREAYRS